MLDDKEEEYDSEPDPTMVEQLVEAAIEAMDKACIDGITTPSEVLSASFTILERNLLALREMQDPADRVENTKVVAAILEDLLLEYGHLPN